MDYEKKFESYKEYYDKEQKRELDSLNQALSAKDNDIEDLYYKIGSTNIELNKQKEAHDEIANKETGMNTQIDKFRNIGRLFIQKYEYVLNEYNGLINRNRKDNGESLLNISKMSLNGKDGRENNNKRIDSPKISVLQDMNGHDINTTNLNKDLKKDLQVKIEILKDDGETTQRESSRCSKTQRGYKNLTTFEIEMQDKFDRDLDDIDLDIQENRGMAVPNGVTFIDHKACQTDNEFAEIQLQTDICLADEKYDLILKNQQTIDNILEDHTFTANIDKESK